MTRLHGWGSFAVFALRGFVDIRVFVIQTPLAGLDALLAELVRVVDETLQPEHVSVWLRETKSPKGG